ncbi:hypothetical protein HMPREF0514_10964 [Lactobacillus paragasseri JV-V03]|uniref:Uncharacterized protein n=1 Tax=Lactobacillus paragasseri JV-V03 TaxID=525326 RepID=A0AA86ZXI4_9LACO|nr:hypothetical protein [Lactobacillus paragasseri]EFJ70520.1 hypothetical protein HMPREF0514_10964 [Lactobacillus paragasseri JV-V03]
MNEKSKILDLIYLLRKDLDHIELDIDKPDPKKLSFQKAWSTAVEMDQDLGELTEELLRLYLKESKARRELRKHEV